MASSMRSLLFFLYSLCCTLHFSEVFAYPQLLSDERVPVRASPDIGVRGVRREIRSIPYYANSTNDYKATETLDTSWDAATLLEIKVQEGGKGKSSVALSQKVEIVCAQCYLKGVASAELVIGGRLNASQYVQKSINAVSGEVDEFTDAVGEYIEDYLGDIWEGITEFNLDDVQLPTLEYDFAIDGLEPVPDVTLHLQFDGLELFMLLDTTLTLAAQYTQNLYTSKTLYGIEIGGQPIGFVFKIDLILEVEGSIDISSGFHIRMEDGLGLDIALFGDTVSDIVSNGGHFEFLPVTVQSPGVTLKAALRIGVHAGLGVKTPEEGIVSWMGGAGGGVEVAVFANVAEFSIELTSDPDDDADCALGIIQSYQFTVGAAAGATVQYDTYTWGPVAETSVPVFFTQMGSACAMDRSAMATAPPNTTLAKRQGLSTATISTEVTYTGVQCASTGYKNCPASLQQTTQYTTSKTLVTAVPSDMDEDDIEWPSSSRHTVATKVPFGSNALSMPRMSGSPTSWVPPPPTGEATAQEKEARKIGLGVGLGLGLPILLVGAAVAIFFIRKRKRYTAVPIEPISTDSQPYTNYPHEPMMYVGQGDAGASSSSPLQPSYDSRYHNGYISNQPRYT